LETIAREHPEVRLLSLQVASQVVWYVVKFCVPHHAGALYHSLEYSFFRIFRCNGYFAMLLFLFLRLGAVEIADNYAGGETGDAYPPPPAPIRLYESLDVLV
jgi:hypothetical protein